MLEADKSVWFEKLFAIYNRNLLKRRFNSLRVEGLENLAAKDPSTPLVIYSNHSSWWDGLIAFQISKQMKLDSFIMMEEKQLKKLFLFRKLGAFSVVRENPRKAVRSLDYAARLLKSDSRRTLWIFPQGEILPNDLRPLKFYRGLSRIAEKLGSCSIVCLAIRYEFLGNFKPEILVRIGTLENIFIEDDFNAAQLTDASALSLATQLDTIKSDITSSNLTNYQNII